MKNPKKSLVRTLMMGAALAGGLTLAQSFYNEAQATSGGATTPPSCKWASSLFALTEILERYALPMATGTVAAAELLPAPVDLLFTFT